MFKLVLTLLSTLLVNILSEKAIYRALFNEVIKASDVYPSNHSEYITKFSVTGGINSFGATKKNALTILSKLKFSQDKYDKFSEIFSSSDIAVKSFTIQASKSNNTYEKFVGAAMIEDDKVIVAYIKAEVTVSLKEQYITVIERRCTNTTKKNRCIDVKVEKIRDYTNKEREIVSQYMKATILSNMKFRIKEFLDSSISSNNQDDGVDSTIKKLIIKYNKDPLIKVVAPQLTDIQKSMEFTKFESVNLSKLKPFIEYLVSSQLHVPEQTPLFDLVRESIISTTDFSDQNTTMNSVKMAYQESPQKLVYFVVNVTNKAEDQSLDFEVALLQSKVSLPKDTVLVKNKADLAYKPNKINVFGFDALMILLETMCKIFSPHRSLSSLQFIE